MVELNDLEGICLTIGGIGGISLMLYQLGNPNGDMINDHPYVAIGIGILFGVAIASQKYRDHKETKKYLAEQRNNTE